MRIDAALGFCARAGKLASGDFAVERTVKKGSARAVLLDECASCNTKDKWQGICAGRNIPLIILPGIGRVTGKQDKIVFAVTDDGFYALIKKAFDETADEI